MLIIGMLKATVDGLLFLLLLNLLFIQWREIVWWLVNCCDHALKKSCFMFTTSLSYDRWLVA